MGESKRGEYRMNASVLRFALGDCTMGGVTGRKASVTVEFDADASARRDGMLVRQEGDAEPDLFILPWFGYFKAVPVAQRGGIGPMCGGNYIHSCDSRWTRVFPHPIPVHDRFESQEQYDRNFD